MVDFLGMNTALNLFLYGPLSPKLVLYNVSNFHTKGQASLLHTLFEQTVHFCKNIPCMVFLLFIIAKGLAMSQLGGAISTQIVQFQALFKAGFMRFLCTN